ncbi:MAG: transcriptional regulator GcvA [Gammaproteobacteria bacterium]|nr:transcriptional regulator GcvA [Gammaproteobacteria bacterium]
MDVRYRPVAKNRNVIDEANSQMPRSLPPLNSLRTFEAAARLGSFSKAARELNVTPAAVSHQIRGLEEYLGITLFRRTTRRLVLTDHATAAAETLREAFDRIGQSVETLRSSDPSGKSGALSISVTPAFATRWLVPRLPHFQKRNPRIHLRIAASPSPVDFDQEDVDVAVRIGRGGFAGVVAINLFHEWLAPVASPAFLRQNVLRKPADITRVPMLHDNSMRRAGRSRAWQEWFRVAGVPLAEAHRGTQFDDGHLALQAAAAGGGVALGRLVYAVDDLAARRLRIAMQPVIEMDIAYHLLIPELRRNLPAVVAFRTWIEAEAADFRRDFQKLFRATRIRGSSARTPVRLATAE